MSLDDMVRRGELERLPPTVGEIPALLKTICRPPDRGRSESD